MARGGTSYPVDLETTPKGGQYNNEMFKNDGILDSQVHKHFQCC